MSSQRRQVVEFNYDISCPFAYIASTRIEALVLRRNAHLIWSPVLLGAIYRETAAPQGAAGSASDVFNPTKKTLTSRAFQRTIKRYNVPFRQPSVHPQKTTSALRMIYSVPVEERPTLTHALFRAYWVDDRNVTDPSVLVDVARRSGIPSAKDLTELSISGNRAQDEALREATANVIKRGAPGVPSFWVPDEKWVNQKGMAHQGRLYWGQDRMLFVEAVLIAASMGIEYDQVPGVAGLLPRCLRAPLRKRKTKLEFWYDFSSPWAFLGWTQLERLKREAGPDLEIDMKPILLGALFRDIGAPNVPAATLSAQKLAYVNQDSADWTRHWNAVNMQSGSLDKTIKFRYPQIFPIRTPTVLRVAIVEPSCVPVLFRACWEQNIDVSKESILSQYLSSVGYDGPALIKAASTQRVKDILRTNTSEAREIGLCGAPSYRVFEQDADGKWVICGGPVWGQDELGVVQDLIDGWKEDEKGAWGKAEVSVGGDGVTGPKAVL